MLSSSMARGTDDDNDGGGGGWRRWLEVRLTFCCLDQLINQRGNEISNVSVIKAGEKI